MWRLVNPSTENLFLEVYITGLLARDARGDAYGTTIMELQNIFQESAHELVDPQYWKHMLRELRIAFSPLATPEILRGQIEALREDEPLLRVLLYLAISNSDFGTLEECCGVQAAAFDFLLSKEPGGKLMTRYLTVYILRFWRHVGETPVLALRNPLIFRNAARRIQEPTFSNIALLLLLAESATGSRFSDDLHRRLVEASQQA